MRFVKVRDEERAGDVAINLDLVREVHFGKGMLQLYFELYCSRFLGHDCCHIRPDLGVALVGDRRSWANGVRRFLQATSPEAPTPRPSTLSCGLQRGHQVSTYLDW